METKNGKTVFVEYSTANKGQHFMTIVQTMDHRRIIIGRIYRDYDKETKKTNYIATDFDGNKVFVDEKDLYAIKKKFIEHGQNLAQMIPNPGAYAKQNKPFVFTQKAERNNELKNVREKKSEKEKTKEVSKQNPNAKTNENQKEKEKDLKNTEKYKDTEKSKEVNNSKENSQEQETAESNSEAQVQEVPDIESERMEELDDLREQGEDLEQEIDR